MKEKTNLQSLFVAIILILAGIISHSNGVDDAVRKSPYEILFTIFIVIISVVSIYLICIAIENYKETSKTK